MGKRLEIGCRCLVVAAGGIHRESPRPATFMAAQFAAIGKEAVLVEGPYQHQGRQCWSIEGPAAEAFLLAVGNSRQKILSCVPSGCLVRLDDDQTTNMPDEVASDKKEPANA